MKRVFAHIGFSFAVTLIVLNVFGKNYSLIILAGLALIFIASLALEKYRRALTVPVCIGSAMVACLIFSLVLNCTVAKEQALDSTTAKTTFYAVDLAEKSDYGYTYVAKTTRIESNSVPQNIKVRITTSYKLKPYKLYTGNIKFSSISDDAYSAYGFWSNNIYLYASAKNIKSLDTEVNSLNKYILNVREDIINTLADKLDGDNGALAVALVTGDKSNLSEDAITNFKISGATHLMAVSGLHISIVAGIFLLLFKLLKINQKIANTATIFLLVCYAGVAGFSKSAVRAVIMMSVMLIGQCFKRKADGLNSLGLAVFIMCLNPFAVTDIGALLSVLAVLALVTVYPKFASVISGLDDSDKFTFSIKKSVAKAVINVVSSFYIALCVMIFTLPVLYVFFGYISIAGLVANIVLAPLGSATMICSLSAYVSTKIGWLYKPCVFLAKLGTNFMLKITEYFASFKNSVLTLNQNFGIVIVVVLVVTAIYFMFGEKVFNDKK